MKVFLYPFFRYEIFTITTLFPVITTVHPTSNNMFFIALSIRRFPFDGNAQIFRYFSFIELTLNSERSAFLPAAVKAADELAGQHLKLFLEELREILGRVEAHLHGKLSHFDVRPLTHDAARLFQPDAIDEPSDRLTSECPQLII